jgi:glycosyltransferase involved in cell wall biosynthesis
MNNIKIAFHIMDGKGWIAGLIYLKNLLYALRQTYGKEVGLYLLVPAEHHSAQEYANAIGANGVIFYKMFRRWTPLWAVNGLVRHLSFRNIQLEMVLKKNGINVVFAPCFVGKYPQIATLSWLPDFQHIHLPAMFSEAERLSRDRTFLQSAKLATRIILMSEAAKKDFESFAPGYAHKARALHPFSYVPPSVYNSDLKSILNLYHLPERFIYLPNQFWKHKNHEIVFEALKILKDKGNRVVIMCTGYPGDYRHSTYFADLWQKISQWNIRDQVIYLGLIPHEHVLLLMRQSICVLNPSLFEGFGITVDEAHSVGKQVLLSDIPVHREQNPPKATFFDPTNVEDLTEKMERVWKESSPGPDFELEDKARKELPNRIREYAQSFMSLIKEVYNK